MRTFLVIATTLSVAACGSPVYTDKQRDQVVKLLERHCTAPSYNTSETDERLCANSTYLLYKLDNGQQVVGYVDSFNRETGRLRVRWQSSPYYVEPEDFYPGTERALAGKITKVESYDYDSDRWRSLQEAFDKQDERRTMRR